MNLRTTLFAFLVVSVIFQSCQKQTNWLIRQDSNGTLVLEGTDSVLFYQKATKSLNGEYARANYIHPLYSLNNTRLTEDFPEDHLHHRGIFWAWHQNYVGDKSVGDAWALENFSWDVRSVTATPGPEACILRTEVDWQSPLWLNEDGRQQAFLKEKTLIRIQPTHANYRIIDFDIELAPLVDSFYIGGSEDVKGYSGFSWRIPLPEDVTFTGIDGPVTPQNEALAAGPWMDIRGNLDGRSGQEGVVVISDPANPGHPHEWILRSARSMQNAAYPGRERLLIRREEPLVLSYRIIVYKSRYEGKNKYLKSSREK